MCLSTWRMSQIPVRAPPRDLRQLPTGNPVLPSKLCATLPLLDIRSNCDNIVLFIIFYYSHEIKGAPLTENTVHRAVLVYLLSDMCQKRQKNIKMFVCVCLFLQICTRGNESTGTIFRFGVNFSHLSPLR